MSVTRANHYVPQWYQRQYLRPGHKTLAYLDLKPDSQTLADGRLIRGKSRFVSPTSRCFYQTDLYSTFFGSWVNDEIERKLFGSIDVRGSKAIRAFSGTDQSAWHRHFHALFEYLDIQKSRTPKGLDWLKRNYPALDQNELMMEMQGIRNLNCTIWAESVREIVSAEEANIKFIISDHPVTIYNYALSPEAAECGYPLDPHIALKATQTLFPLGPDFCLILTNLEYAREPACPPIEKRTFARNFGNALVNTIDFIRSRKLDSTEVATINHVLKSRARRYIAAGDEAWLYPETIVATDWAGLRFTLLPPRAGMSMFGGEIYASYEDGRVHYQDEFGRTEKPREFLIKTLPAAPLKPNGACGCGSGQAFKGCCKTRPTSRRPSWTEQSIRERNLTLHRGVVDILGLGPERDWVAVRRGLTDDQVRKVYLLFDALWPRETDLLSLLPKPDGRPRAIYTGSIHPETIQEFAFGASLYFGELIMEHPFVHAGIMRKEFSPLERPRTFHLEMLKAVAFLLNVMPLVDLGLVNLIPDPGIFDVHLREQVMHIAKERHAGVGFDINEEPRLVELARRDSRRHLMMGPTDYLARQLREDQPDLGDEGIKAMLRSVERLREMDPLVPLTEGLLGGGNAGGQFQTVKLAPNFEMAMYLAQATGAAIVTDSPFRWREVLLALRPRFSPAVAHLRTLGEGIAKARFLFPSNTMDVGRFSFEKALSGYPEVMADAFRYLAEIEDKGTKPNWEAHLAARFGRIHRPAQAALAKSACITVPGRLTCAFPAGGIQNNSVNRLLLMSRSEHHLQSVPTAYLMERAAASDGIGVR